MALVINNVATEPADEQPFIIEELAAPYAVLVLDRKDRPEPPIEVTTEQRANRTWNPGSRRATAQVMGTDEQRIQLVGRWHDDEQRLLGTSPLDQLRQARGLLARLNTCRLVWGEAIVRNGRVVRVSPTFYRDKDIGYEILFEPDEALENYDALPPNEAATTLRKVRRLTEQVTNTLADTLVAASLGNQIASRKR